MYISITLYCVNRTFLCLVFVVLPVIQRHPVQLAGSWLHSLAVC